MNLYDYLKSQEISKQDYPFYALIMAAMRQADTHNLEDGQALAQVGRDIDKELDKEDDEAEEVFVYSLDYMMGLVNTVFSDDEDMSGQLLCEQVGEVMAVLYGYALYSMSLNEAREKIVGHIVAMKGE